MAKSVNSRMFIHAPMLVLVLAAIMAPCKAATDALVDPTLPPAAMIPPGTGKSSDDLPVGPVLQSVMMAPGRKFATISGQTLRVGEKFGGATLVKVSDQEVVLRESDGTLQILKMHPAVDKTVSMPSSQDVLLNAHKTKTPVQSAAPDIR